MSMNLFASASGDISWKEELSPGAVVPFESPSFKNALFPLVQKERSLFFSCSGLLVCFGPFLSFYLRKMWSHRVS
jgi:hypothetical protein